MEVKIKIDDEIIDAKIVMMNGDMIVSPNVKKFEPKDGDVVTNIYNGIYQGTGIFDYEEDSEAWIHVCITKSGVLETDGYLGYVNDLRLATEEEKKKLFDKLKENGYEWDAEKKELVKLKWKPAFNETYYRPDFNKCRFICYSGTFDYHKMNFIEDHINKGWVFKTEEECQAFCGRLNDAINSVKP